MSFSSLQARVYFEACLKVNSFMSSVRIDAFTYLDLNVKVRRKEPEVLDPLKEFRLRF